MVASYFSLVTLGAPVKRTTMLIAILLGGLMPSLMPAERA